VIPLHVELINVSLILIKLTFGTVEMNVYIKVVPAMELVILTEKPVDLETIYDVLMKIKIHDTMNVETHAFPYGHLAMVHVSMVQHFVELLEIQMHYVSQMIIIVHIGNVGMNASLLHKLVMESVLRDAAFVGMTPVFFLDKRKIIMTAMETAILCGNPVMEHVSKMVMLLVTIVVLMKTLQTSMKNTVSAMEHVKINVTNVMMEAV